MEEDNETLSQALVELEMGQTNSVKFEVFTPNEAKLWANSEAFDPVGMGSPVYHGVAEEDQADYPVTNLIWENRTAGSEIFYIVVTNLFDTPSYYQLDISGNGVSFPMGSLATNGSN